ncbi:MAG: hypothetical protein HZA90_16505 [Verrucomicrobia bacterium]|nr:hypothetical protein [Verrucomicrobiota bacterium]
MKSGSVSFNTYLCALALAAVVCGCHTEKANEKNPKKQLTLLRLHTESAAGRTSPGIEVPIYRARPTMVPIDRDAFVTEANVVAAAVLEQQGSFAIELQLDRQGTWLLEKFTVTNPGRRIAVFCSFPEDRWVAAPIVPKVISTGRLVFTPDATREEAERIVRGLNNMSRKKKTSSNF